MFRKSTILRQLWLSASLALLPATAATAGSTVEIIRDDWGVPHVYSEDVYGLYAGFGHAVAEYRLFQHLYRELDRFDYYLSQKGL